MEYATLNNGVKMPMVGLGTHKLPNEQLNNIIPLAYELGYRKFDTAWLYENEQYIGNALKTNNIPREQIFLTSKLHNDNLYLGGYHRRIPNLRIRSVRKAFENSCKKLGTDYLDLYLIHWPFDGFEKMWEDVVKLYEDRRIRAIGVSSFLPKHLDDLLSKTSVIPAVNQFEINPRNSQTKEILYNQNKGIHVEAYASFGTTKANETASTDILGNESILAISESHGKTPSQIILRWTTQKGISVIPRSKSRNHLMENLNIFDFELSPEEMKSIDALNQNQYSRGNPHFA